MILVEIYCLVNQMWSCKDFLKEYLPMITIDTWNIFSFYEDLKRHYRRAMNIADTDSEDDMNNDDSDDEEDEGDEDDENIETLNESPKRSTLDKEIT